MKFHTFLTNDVRDNSSHSSPDDFELCRRKSRELWDQFLKEFAYAIRTAVHETTGKSPAELFFGRKLKPPFQKLVMITGGAELVCSNIEKLFELARRNTKIQQYRWAKIL
ncbi:uncharacterized protein NPIL_149851 [Nephila pilipes]|uniref:Uncharacterized protein n=1 Tax=Nephila pilipes TaxID=299642 RepID=A0A8X6R5N1_NEPPI|nr:uncharacterized protein NPIL_149851 [Nephila pilipes]